MKRTLWVALMGAVLWTGCSGSSGEVPFNELEERLHLKGDEDPFTGTAVTVDSRGQKTFRAQYREGIPHGVVQTWHPNEKKKNESEYRRGRLHGRDRWWYSNGRRMTEAEYKEGRIITGTSWGPEGVPLGRVEKGNGILVGYYEDGTRRAETTFRDGVPINQKRWKPDAPPAQP